jgi:hypothetical protein
MCATCRGDLDELLESAKRDVVHKEFGPRVREFRQVLGQVRKTFAQVKMTMVMGLTPKSSRSGGIVLPPLRD